MAASRCSSPWVSDTRFQSIAHCLPPSSLVGAAPISISRHVELDRYGEGIQLLRTSIANHAHAVSRAANYCYLAIGEAAIGSLTEARSSLRIAEQLDPRCDLLDRAATRVAHATS